MKKLALSILTVILAAPVAASPLEVEKRIRDLYPATKIAAVRETPAKGIYEVVMGRNVAYTDEAGRYMIFGHLYDMKEQKDLTASVLEALNKVDTSLFPKEDAIKKVQGKGERTLFVFSDPDCPYCKRLEAELAKVDNVTIYTLLYPLEGLHPDAGGLRLPHGGEPVVPARRTASRCPQKGRGASGCETPIDRNLRLGNTLGVNGTPTIIFADGAIAPGMLPAAEIERRLAGGGRPMGGAVQRQ